MNPKLIVTITLLVTSASAFASRVESEDAQGYGTKSNVMRQTVGAVSQPDRFANVPACWQANELVGPRFTLT